MEASATKPLRHVIIGVGAGILNGHRPALTLPTVDLVAVSDINTTLGQQRADEFHCPFYTDYRQMLAETQPDVAIILTPPFLHASMTIDCLEAGSHVLLEKPMAMQVADADLMIAAAQRNKRLLGIVFQHRFRPEVIAARQILQEGSLGQIQRVELTAVWTRPTSYYAMAAWRATWVGEGGGLLTNQASHNLDILCHLLGAPLRVFAWTRQLLHKIETEDTVQAQLEWADGALGSVHISTAEADDPERLKIVGTRGSLKLGRGTLQVQTLDEDMSDYAVHCLNPYTQPTRHTQIVTLPAGKGDHVAVYHNFQAALLQETSFIEDGIQGRMELELANAMIYSSHRHGEVALPLDRQAYATLLQELQQQSSTPLKLFN